MIPRMTLLALTSATFSLLLWLVSRSYFGDMLPLAEAMADMPPWRFQTAYFLTALIFISAAVAFMSVLGLIALVGSRFLPKGPDTLA